MGKERSLATMELLKHLDVPDGNYVKLEGELLKHFQKVLLSIAEDIIQICEEKGIYYQLSGGSALGAVRHNGFIPWDDDMDINMKGADQEKFISVFREKYSQKYTIQNYLSPDYGLQMAKVRLNGTAARTYLDPENDNCGISIDIFFLENVFDNPIGKKLHGYLCLASGLLLSCRNYYKNRKLLFNITKNNRSAYRLIKTKVNIGRVFCFITVRRMAIFTHFIYSLCKNSNSKYINIPGGRKKYFGEMYLREEMENTIKFQFENHKWNVAKGYDSYFRALYGGDYMTVPDEKDREKHIYLEIKFPSEQL